MTRLTDITSVHWQPALGRDDVVEGVADIDQAIRVILGTPKGRDPHRPDFGSNLSLYLDMPIDRATPHLVREAVDAIRRWEPRCEVVRVMPAIDAAHETLRVQWRLADGVIRETEVPR
ncbi:MULTISPECIES: GPW/gp25 family protein [Burkholderia]|uniref:Baseplate protein n=1 Tax=Burkholderia savannae TaxID=1637837 RepID=A0ABR5T3D0_9BURK|nr:MULTISPECIES: GPW/gp25 family protein [Burkholderia]AOK49436.1 baseplate protein [Burkholderia sp. MSMB617WGS]KVK82091.1 baseplate protein [Burkholderia sp. MSMB1498]KWZ37720.1 baseplate protein [Burkholderia savannae]KWZ48249.1 baseplate protein [Burkholderia savannae]